MRARKLYTIKNHYYHYNDIAGTIWKNRQNYTFIFITYHGTCIDIATL